MSLFRPILYLGLLCLVFVGMLITLAIVGLKDSNSPQAAAPSAEATSVSTAPSNLASPTAAPATGTGGAPATPPAAAAGALEISTPDDIHYDKSELDVAPRQVVTVRYTNNSDIPHNIDFLNGADAKAPTLALSNIAAGPNNVQTVTFTAPSTPGSYLFHCDVHPDQMTGHLVVK